MEKYRRYRVSSYLPQEFQLNVRASEEKALIYEKIARIYKFLEDESNSLSYFNNALNEYQNLDKNCQAKIEKICKEINSIKQRPNISAHNNKSNVSAQSTVSLNESGKSLYRIHFQVVILRSKT